MKRKDRLNLVSSTFGILLSAIVMFVAIGANSMNLALVAFVMMIVMLMVSGGIIRRQE